MNVFHALLACCAFILASAGIEVSAQTPNAVGGAEAPVTAAPVFRGATPATVYGPTIHVVDASARLATVDVAAPFAVCVIGSTGVVLTDIAFDPRNHKLYGISFTSFYAVNRTTGRATRIGDLGVTDANALVFSSTGVAYLAGYRTSALYRVDVRTGKATPLGPTGIYKSAGDLVFFENRLLLAAYTGRTLTNSTPNYLVTLNPSNGAVLGSQPLTTRAVFGLASTGPHELYGLGVIGTTSTPGLFQFSRFPPPGPRQLSNLGARLRQIYGAAYDNQPYVCPARP